MAIYINTEDFTLGEISQSQKGEKKQQLWDVTYVRYLKQSKSQKQRREW